MKKLFVLALLGVLVMPALVEAAPCCGAQAARCDAAKAAAADVNAKVMCKCGAEMGSAQCCMTKNAKPEDICKCGALKGAPSCCMAKSADKADLCKCGAVKGSVACKAMQEKGCCMGKPCASKK